MSYMKGPEENALDRAHHHGISDQAQMAANMGIATGQLAIPAHCAGYGPMGQKFKD